MIEFFKNQIEEKRQFFKFIFSGGVSALTTLALLYLFTNFFHIWYLVSSVIAFSLAIVLNFSLQKFWAFKGNQKKRAHWQFFLFLTINCFNLGLNSAGMYILVDKIGAWYMLAQVAMSAILAVVSYLFYKLVVFKEIKY